MKKPKKLWAFWASAYIGPWYKTPQRVLFNEDLGSYWRKCGSAHVEGQGLYQERGYTSFAHSDKKEVEKFMQGFFAARDLLSGFFKY